MRIGVIIPDRNDRPELLKNCLRMIKNQTLQPHAVELVNDLPKGNQCDITYRYRTGYDRLRWKKLDVIAFMENDDWYSPDYLETMVREWQKHGNPILFGTNYTIYYHLKLRAHFTMNHTRRSSAMSTLIRPDLNFNWCPDHEAFTDIYLWSTLNGELFKPEKLICMGMKHGIGLCGGKNHVDKLHRFINKDEDLTFLRKNLDPESFKFYSNF